jgi:hypothetical protein
MAYVYLAELLRDFEGFPAHRIRMDPPDGTATEADVLNIIRSEGTYCELFDGMLVEKRIGHRGLLVAAEVSNQLRGFVKSRKLGVVASSDRIVRLSPSKFEFRTRRITHGTAFPAAKHQRPRYRKCTPTWPSKS